ncbi:MAG: HAMP domain-containing histidine kinase [Deltaproteobacteria bacterium]|nr:HAMP domain-containing histidine kinase [Deltaproteobacteria bacterium]
MSEAKFSLKWLVLLRWWTIIGQSVAISFVYFLADIKVELFSIVFILLTLIGSNYILQRRLSKLIQDSSKLVAAVLVFDIFLLASLLYLSGGVENPFTVLFLVHVALSAIVLGKLWSWIIVSISSICFGLLFFKNEDHSHMQHAIAVKGFNAHLYGMWFAFVVAAILVVYFLDRIRTELKTQDAKLQELEILKLKHNQLSALATLAGGAAHELATPLNTISIVASELKRDICACNAPRGIMQDIDLIDSEVRRCRNVIDQMGIRGGALAGELPTTCTLDDVKNKLLECFAATEIARIELLSSGDNTMLVCLNGLVQSLTSLVRNALDASEDQQIIKVELKQTLKGLSCTVKDFGLGISAHDLEKVKEPFFTTKEVGKGMGLGLFLVSTYADHVGGDLRIESELGKGSTVTLTVPYSSNQLAA